MSIYKKVIKKWNIEKQTLKLNEEIGELLQAINKHLIRGRWKNRIIEEISDVEIMLQQIKFYYNINKEVQKYKKLKLAKLKKRLSK